MQRALVGKIDACYAMEILAAAVLHRICGPARDRPPENMDDQKGILYFLTRSFFLETLKLGYDTYHHIPQ